MALLSGGVCAAGQTRKVMTIEDLFEIAESSSAQLRPYFTAEDEAAKERRIGQNGC